MNCGRIGGFIAAVSVVAALAVGCSTPDAPTPPTSTQQPPPANPSTSTAPQVDMGGDHAAVTVDPAKVGQSGEAIRSVAENFIVGYAAFSPFDFDPAAEWFARWSTYATPEFVGQAQTGLTSMWQWTWRQQVKAFDVHVVGEPDVDVDSAAGTASVAVRINRLILGINDTADKSREQNLTFRLAMQLRGDSNYALVSQATQLAAPES